MKVAVITPYFKEPLEILKLCHESVKNQDYPARHIMVSDGHPIDEINDWDCDHIILPNSHNDIGSTPRLIGSYHAIGLGYEAVAFLDADNWFRKDHIDSLVDLYHKTNASFLYSTRMLYSLDGGSKLGVCWQIDGKTFIDTNCMMFTKGSFHLLDNWVLMPDYGHLIGDRIMTYHINKSNVRMSYSEKPSVSYRCAKAGIYNYLGLEVPEGVMPIPNYQDSFIKWVEDGNPPLI